MSDFWVSAILFVLIAGHQVASFLIRRRNHRPRRLTTQLSGEQLAAIFERTAGGYGWEVRQEHHTRVAYPKWLVDFGRQELNLQWEDQGEWCTALLWVPIPRTLRVVGQGRDWVPRAPTLTPRIRRFLREVQRKDNTATVELLPPLPGAEWNVEP